MTAQRQAALHRRSILVLPGILAVLLTLVSPLFFIHTLRIGASSNRGKIFLPVVSGTGAALSVKLKGVAHEQTVSGWITVQADVSSSTAISNVGFYMGSKEVGSERTAPFYLGGDDDGKPNGYDTRRLPNGSYTLKAVATDRTGKTAAAQLSITIRNSQSTAPAPEPTPRPVAPTPVPAPPPTASASGTSVLQGLFYDAPDDTSTSTVAARAKVIILTRGKIGWFNKLREAGFSGPGLQYLLGNEVIGPWTTLGSSCDASSTPVNNNVANQPGDFCKYIHPNESWFLHNESGERLTNRHSDGRYSYHMNPGSSGWREFAKSRIARDLYGDNKIGYDGIFLDNIALRLYKLHNQLSSSDGTVREYSSDSAYRSAVVGYLSAVDEKIGSSGPLWANLIDDSGVSADAYMPYVHELDGYMNEAWASNYPGRDPKTPAEWNNVLTITERALRNGKSVLAVVQGSRGDTTRQQFALASYLLVSNGSKMFFRYAHVSDYDQWWQYDNYDVQLGRPKGERFESGGKWRRYFECGYVEVDPSARTGKIVRSCS